MVVTRLCGQQTGKAEGDREEFGVVMKHKLSYPDDTFIEQQVIKNQWQAMSDINILYYLKKIT